MNFLVLDTNIPLLDATNILTLGNADTTIVLPETVLAELDSKKDGHDEINYQARVVARLLEKSIVLEVVSNQDAIITKLDIDGTRVDILMLTSYKADATSYGGNDRRIIEVARYLTDTRGNTKLMTNDIHMKFQSIAAKIDTISLKVVDESDAVFVKELLVEDPEVFRTLHKANILEVDPEYEAENYSYKFTCNNTNQMKLATVHNGFIEVLGKDTEKALKLQKCAPINSEQLLASKAIQDPTIDLIMLEGLAGSGKNIVALSNAIRLIQTNKDKYTSIVYIRSPQNDESPGEDIGYLAGNDEKMSLYLGPMEDSLDFVVRSNINTKGMPKVDVDAKVEQETEKLKTECGMESMISTGLRGKTFHDTIFIVDEAQNGSAATTQKVLTRVGKNCKVIVVGSQRQIDSKYVNKYNNGLAILMDEAKKRKTSTDIKMFAINFHKVVRSEMALFAEELFSK